MRRIGQSLAWAALACAMIGPLVIAANSPWLAGRDAVYILAGFAGIAALALLLAQPLLAAGYLPGLDAAQGRRWHRRIGIGIVTGIALHVIGLYLTSPQDALDALLLVSPTPFSVYGVIGLWSVILTALLVAGRSRLRMRPARWALVHNGLAAVVVVSSIVHALMIEGTMGSVSKGALCLGIAVATGAATLHLRVLRPRARAAATSR